ncbi:unnamed protein product [Rotaria sordida]|uniref:Transient receptor potential cation channel subfamily A member 1 n=1 Tax=Rotaria sordida TaxID=392033 RepID=A0A814QHT4_9BILA|nr:unnamed protein product [Rotaria sordida]
MTDFLIAPEPLNKLIWRFDNKNLALSSSIVVDDVDRENHEHFQSNSSSIVNSCGTGENVNIAERYLLEAIRASANEVEEKWNQFIQRIEYDHYTHSQIKKIIHNLDRKKQYSALHYAVWHNNIYLVEKLLEKKSKFSSDVNILSGYGEHVLHIVAQSKAIWTMDKSREEEKQESANKSRERRAEASPIRRITNSQIEPEKQLSNIPKVLRLLLPLCKKVDHRDNEKRTPLHVAVLYNQLIYVDILLQSGADISAKSVLHHNVFHYVALSLCSSEDKDKMFDRLINSPKLNPSLLTIKNLEGLTPLSMAIGYGTPHMINTIVSRIDTSLFQNELSMCIDMLAKRSKILPTAILERFLLSYHRPQESATLFHIICHYDNPELLKYILDYTQNRTHNLDKLLKQTDEHGYTPLLTAVYYGHKSMVEILLDCKVEYLHIMTHDKKNILHLIAQRQHEHVFKILNEKLNANDFSILMSPQPLQATPLHEISKTNNVLLCDSILKSYKEDKLQLFKHQNVYGRTIFHEACEYGRLEMIKYLTSDNLIKDEQIKIELLAVGDDEKRTCLHLAAAEGHADVVAYLLQTHLVNINALTEKFEAAFHYACANGYRSVVIELLANECNTLIRNAQLYNGLELAILNHNEDVARLLLLEFYDWRPMLQNAQFIWDSPADAYDTPFRKLIRYMPELALDVIDQQFTRTSGFENMTVDKQIYDYEFLEDQLTVKHWYSKVVTSDITSDGALVKCCGIFKYRTEYEPYTGDSYTLVRNHPLFIISDSDNQSLMEHSFCQTLRAKKYSEFGQYLLVLSFILYVLYLCAYTAIILRTKHPQYFYSLVNETSINNDVCESVANRLTSYNIREAFKDNTFKNLKIGIYTFLCLFITKNCILILTLFPRLFRKGSYYLEAAALILAFICVLDHTDWLDLLLIRCPTQYQIGAVALLLSWLNFLVYIRCIPIIGIYVVMLEVISKKFVRFLPVLLVIISGFGFTYYALLQNQEVYSTPLLSLIKTSLIMFEMNFDDRIYKESEGGINYYPVTFVLFILTGYVMTVFVINLLIGLAVGEIPTLVQQGTLLQSRIYYDTLSDYEILRLQIRSVILWIISHICCCCSSSFKYKIYRLVDRSFLHQRPILFQIHDRKKHNLPKRIGHYIKKNILNEQIQESVDEEVKEQYEKRKKTKIQRADDDENREKKELADLQNKKKLRS